VTPGPFELIISELETVYAQVKAIHPKLTVYPMHESGMDLPAVYSVFDDSKMELADVDATHRDAVVIAARVMARPAESPEENLRFLRYIDTLISVLDPALNTNPPLNGAIRTGKRIQIRGFAEEYGGTVCLGIEALLRLTVDRRIAPS
jgi:hypothetical protein